MLKDNAFLLLFTKTRNLILGKGNLYIRVYLLLFRYEWVYWVSLSASAAISVQVGVFGEVKCIRCYFGVSRCIR